MLARQRDDERGQVRSPGFVGVIMKALKGRMIIQRINRNYSTVARKWNARNYGSVAYEDSAPNCLAPFQGFNFVPC
jgi:hypothetical protein